MIAAPGQDDSFADVTVIIPAYAAEQTIARALSSVAAQTLKPRRAIVVDDGSPDRTGDAALACRERMNGVELKIVRQDNSGAGAARNRALEEAETEYVAFLDADDEWLPQKMTRSMAHLAGSENILVAHDSWEIRDGVETPVDCAARFRAGHASPFAALYRRGFISTTTVVARRNEVLAAGGFDPSLPNAQDFELWLAMLKEPGARFEVFGEKLSRYHITSGSIMSHIERRRLCCMEIARRYAPALRRHPGSPLASLWFRIAAIHYEAFTAHRTKGDRLAALRVVLLFPAALLMATAFRLARQMPARRAIPT